MQCVSTADGYQLWSRRYDHNIHDVFAVQDEIASEIVNTLCINTPGRRPAPPGGTDSFEAYDWYLRGRYHLNRQTSESLYRAIDCFGQALARRPTLRVRRHLEMVDEDRSWYGELKLGAIHEKELMKRPDTLARPLADMLCRP
jgi:hypothetical protein